MSTYEPDARRFEHPDGRWEVIDAVGDPSTWERLEAWMGKRGFVRAEMTDEVPS